MCVCVCVKKEKMHEQKSDQQILKFCSFKLNEKFAEKQKYKIFSCKQNNI